MNDYTFLPNVVTNVVTAVFKSLASVEFNPAPIEKNPYALSLKSPYEPVAVAFISRLSANNATGKLSVHFTR